MNSLKNLTIILTVFLCSIASFAQENEGDDKLSLDSGTIDNQFEYVITKSNNYQDYKVVKKNWLYSLKAHTLDSLKAVRKDLADTQIIVDTQAKEILELKANLENTKVSLEKTKDTKDNIRLFGAQMSKDGYKAIMWLIIAGLLALLIFFIYKFKNSNAITKSAKKSLSDIEEEFEEHRKTALEREQKVRRQLQDEINKQKKTK